MMVRNKGVFLSKNESNEKNKLWIIGLGEKDCFGVRREEKSF